MTLMPVSNIWDRGSSSSNGGDGRWISQRSSMSSTWSVSRGWPITLNTWPSTPLPTGTVMPRPLFLTGVPRRRPSVGRRQMQRTRPSPICWATSATMVSVWPSISTSKEMAWLISGSAPGGNSTSTTGPAMATMRPSRSSLVSAVAGSTAVMCCSWSAVLDRGPGGSRRVRVFVGFGVVAGAAAAQGLGAADDLHDLGGDGILPGPVHDPGQAGHELVGVVGGRLHGPLAGRVLGRRGGEEGGQQLALQPAGQQPVEQLRRFGLVLVVDDELVGVEVGRGDGDQRPGGDVLAA